MNKVVHFGAGNIGKALVFPIFKANNFEFTFVDANLENVNALKKDNYFYLHNPESNKNIKFENFNILHISEQVKILKSMSEADIITTSIGINNLKKLKTLFKKFLKKQTHKNINIICIENGVNVTSNFKKELEPFTNKNIHFVDCIADKISIKTKNCNYHNVYAEEYHDLSVNTQQWYGKQLKEINYFKNLTSLVFKKLWILNSTHSLLGWLIWDEYDYVHEITKNKEKEKIILDYMNLAVEITAQNFPELPKQELEKYKKIVYQRFINKSILDTPKRVGRNLRAKVSKNERFISLYNAAKNKEKIKKFITLIYELNNQKQIDKEINNYSKQNGLKNTIKKFSSICI